MGVDLVVRPASACLRTSSVVLYVLVREEAVVDPRKITRARLIVRITLVFLKSTLALLNEIVLVSFNSRTRRPR